MNGRYIGFWLGRRCDAFRVEFSAHSGINEFLCSVEEYILDATEQAGVDLAYSCRAGSCGSCVASSTQGAPD